MTQAKVVEIAKEPQAKNWLRRGAYKLAHVLSCYLVRQGHFQGLRSNLAVVYGLPEDSPDVEARVIENLRNAFVCYVDFFIIACKGPEAIDAACELDPDSLRLIERNVAEGKGVVLVAPHSSSLDIFMLAISRRFPDVQALTLAKPPINTRLMNRLRGKYGMLLTPISSTSLRVAMRRLRNGGIVGIAADVPAPFGAEFDLFGRPCRLPIGHTRIAMATNSAIVVGISQRVGPGQYRGFGFDVPATGEDEDDWAEATLRVLERYILERPQEWFMPPPLWQESKPPLALLQHRLPPSLTSRLIQG